MKNLSLASAIGFDATLLNSEGFEKRWAIFRDSEQCKFLILLSEKHIGELQSQLENEADPAQVPKLQGQIVEARRMKNFLEQKNISNEVTSMRNWLGLRK